MRRPELSRLLTLVAANPGVRFCIVDPGGAVSDVAAVFHAGAVDYLGKSVLSRPPEAGRRKAVLAHAGRVGNGLAEAATAPLELPADASDGWAEIEAGQEHTFAFLLIEADDAEEMKLRHEPQNLAAAMGKFRGFIERIVTLHGGRLWMWSNFGGLVLFPLHQRSPQAPLCGLRILLSSIFYDSEESLLPGRLSFRMALSVGSTVYHEQETGKIISDAVNSIFHLGRRYAQPGQFVITAEAYELVPQPMRPLFKPAGAYEGRRIHCMLRPSSAAGVRGGGSRDNSARDGAARDGKSRDGAARELGTREAGAR